MKSSIILADANNSRFVYSVYVPLNYNNSSRVETEKLLEIQHMFIKQFGGLTVKGPWKGFWIDDEKCYCDSVLEFVIAIQPDRIDDMRRVVIEVGQMLGQKSMYLEYRDTDVEFLDIPLSEDCNDIGFLDIPPSGDQDTDIEFIENPPSGE